MVEQVLLLLLLPTWYKSNKLNLIKLYFPQSIYFNLIFWKSGTKLQLRLIERILLLHIWFNIQLEPNWAIYGQLTAWMDWDKWSEFGNIVRRAAHWAIQQLISHGACLAINRNLTFGFENWSNGCNRTGWFFIEWNWTGVCIVFCAFAINNFWRRKKYSFEFECQCSIKLRSIDFGWTIRCLIECVGTSVSTFTS